MVDHVSPEALQNLLAGNTQFAFIDVREGGRFGTPRIWVWSRRHLRQREGKKKRAPFPERSEAAIW